MTNPAYEATNSDVVLHMGEAIHVFDALKTDLISKDVLNEHLGPMGATAVEVWSAKTGQTLTMHHAMGGCSLYIRTPNTNGMMQLSNELAEMKRKLAEMESRPLCVKSNDAMREAAPLCVKLPAAATDVLAERHRQITSEGWTPEHDDEHDSGEMAGAAACYARYTNARSWIFKSNPDGYRSESEPHDWPWSPDWWKPTDPRRDLVKAGALIIAEIERIDRAASSTVEGSECDGKQNQQ